MKSVLRTHEADLAIDLGTANTLVVKRGAGVIFNEPSLCCFAGSGSDKKLFAAGVEAGGMVGRVTRGLHITKPLRGGVLSDIDGGRELIRYAIKSARRGWFSSRPRALIGVPADATEAEKRALATVATDAGIAKVELVTEPFLAAIGAGLDVHEARGRMLVDCGAGTTEVAVISLGGICLSKTVRIGGETLDSALADHLHLRRRFHIGSAAAERLKLEITHLLDVDAGDTRSMLEIRGQNLATGLPQTLSIPCSELVAVYERHLWAIVDTVRAALNETPPELSQDIYDDGLTLTGGGSMAPLLGRRITEATGLGVSIPAEPLRSVAEGLERLLQGAA